MDPENRQYKLSFEVVKSGNLHKYSNEDPRWFTKTEQTVPNSQIPDSDWEEVSKIVDSFDDIRDQVKNLRLWDSEDRGFVRNIQIFERPVMPWSLTAV